MIRMFNIDCMDFMKGLPDKAYELAIVDPPYGIGADSQKESYSQGKNGEGRRHRKLWEHRGWDENIPTAEYWNELFRVSKNQIVWGGNYMTEFLKPSKCWLIWDKVQEFTGSDFEMAWTSFDRASKAFRMSRIEAYSNKNKIQKDSGIKIHPTQKPVKLYKRLLCNYAKPGDKILDTHGGSGSIAIACYDLGFDLDWMELDKDYFDAAVSRYESHVAKYSPASEIPVTKKGEIKLF